MPKSRDKWIAYERQLAIKYRNIYPNCTTSRYSSREMDDKGVDLYGTGTYSIQAKCYAKYPVSVAIQTLKEMPKDENVNVLHVKIANPKLPLKKRWSVVILTEDDWMSLLSQLEK